MNECANGPGVGGDFLASRAKRSRKSWTSGRGDLAVLVTLVLPDQRRDYVRKVISRVPRNKKMSTQSLPLTINSLDLRQSDILYLISDI